MKPTGEGRRNQHGKDCVVKISASFFVQMPEETLYSTVSQHHFSTTHQKIPWFLGRDCGCLRSMIEESKLLHFVRFREKSLWKSPDLTPPPENQSEPLASPGKFQSSPGNGNQSAPVASRETRTNQNSTRNPSPEGDQSDPETPVFLIFPGIIPYISNVTQSSGLLPIAAASVSVGAPARAW